MATKGQIVKIHALKGALKMDDATYRAILAGAGVTSSTKLSVAAADRLIADLEPKAIAAGCWEKRSAPRRAGKRPKNMDRSGSRADQLGKIEALLTVGGKSWEYAHGIARRICRVDKVQWVPEEDLYKIITALRKQAKREGWDLSGEQR